MRFYIISGEASGDLHASNLLKEIKQLLPNVDARAWGGELLQSQGATLVKHYRELAFMGFVEVVKNLKTILDNISFCKNDILQFKPDALILVDYPGFNLRIAKWAKQQNIKIIYYISPQVWAWKQSRVKRIKRDVDLMLCILPFEVDFYKKFGFKAYFVGHPLLDAVQQFNNDNLLITEDAFKARNKLNSKPIIALLPGSRKQEIQTKLAIMLKMVNRFPEYQFVVAAAPGIEPEFYNQFVQSKVKVVMDQTYLLLKFARAALVTSGTATLETALFNVPQVVCYKGSNLSYQIARRIIKVKYISLVNLIMNKKVVTELIQNELNEVNLYCELNKILNDASFRSGMLNDYAQLKSILGGSGASAIAAQKIVQFLKF